MSQHDMVIADDDGAGVRSDMNGAFQALASTSKGSTDPATPYAGQHSIRDDSPSGSVWTQRVYDGADQIPVARIDTTNDRCIPYNGPHGQCRLTKSGSNLLLSPLNGNVLIINGAPEVIPSAGVTLSPSGLSANTTYFIYAYMNSGVMTLEASATGHATDSTTGVEIKSGNATRTLVGMARTNGSTAWVDSAAQRLVISWFNRRTVVASTAFTTNRSTTSSSVGEINAETKAEFLTWGDEALSLSAGGTATTTATALISTQIGFDGSAINPGEAFNVSNQQVPYGISVGYAAAEGYHYTSIFGSTSTGTLNYVTGGTNSVLLRG